jgi:hypothetical protein
MCFDDKWGSDLPVPATTTFLPLFTSFIEDPGVREWADTEQIEISLNEISTESSELLADSKPQIRLGLGQSRREFSIKPPPPVFKRQIFF